MGLLGKYTTYVGGVPSAAHKLLSKLYPASPFASQVAAGDEKAAQSMIIGIARANVDAAGVGGLQPANGIQAGDAGMFPTGVRLGFGDAPDITQVSWKNPGDPANPYVPDISSPGPGKTDGRDKATDPGLSVQDMRALATTEDTSDQNLRNPSKDGPAVYGNNAIGSPQKMGDSGGNV